MPGDVRIYPELYQQKIFIDLAIENVVEALRDGDILVVIILFVFLLNFRTTFITLTAIPLSIVITGLVFHWFGLSLNTMTLGGLAAAIGELVDDALCDALSHGAETRGRLQLTINGKPHSGTIEHAGHVDHDHASHGHD